MQRINKEQHVYLDTPLDNERALRRGMPSMCLSYSSRVGVEGKGERKGTGKGKGYVIKYVSLSTCVYIYIYIYTYIHTYIYIYICMHIHIHIRPSNATSTQVMLSAPRPHVASGERAGRTRLRHGRLDATSMRFTRSAHRAASSRRGSPSPDHPC